MSRDNEDWRERWEAFQRGERNPEWWLAECIKSRRWVDDDVKAFGAEPGRGALSLDQRRLMVLINVIAGVPNADVSDDMHDLLEGLGNGVGVPILAIEKEIERREQLFGFTPSSEE